MSPLEKLVKYEGIKKCMKKCVNNLKFKKSRKPQNTSAAKIDSNIFFKVIFSFFIIFFPKIGPRNAQ